MPFAQTLGQGLTPPPVSGPSWSRGPRTKPPSSPQPPDQPHPRAFESMRGPRPTPAPGRAGRPDRDDPVRPLEVDICTRLHTTVQHVHASDRAAPSHQHPIAVGRPPAADRPAPPIQQLRRSTGLALSRGSSWEIFSQGSIERRGLDAPARGLGFTQERPAVSQSRSPRPCARPCPHKPPRRSAAPRPRRPVGKGQKDRRPEARDENGRSPGRWIHRSGEARAKRCKLWPTTGLFLL